MIKEFYISLFRFILLILLQIYLFNNIQFSGFINPYPYLLFILLLPLDIPGWFLLVLGFITGITIDIFSHTIGMHTTATVLLAFLRPNILRIISPRDGYEAGSRPTIAFFGFQWFIRYITILVFVHHLILFYAEAFTFSSFFSTLLRVLLSTLFTLLVIVLSQYLFAKK